MTQQHGVARWLPLAQWLTGYRRADLARDLLAGTVVAALAVPQSLGYAAIAGVPVQVGLYSIPLALAAYALLGSSPHLVVGPVSTMAVLSGSLVAGMAAGDPSRAVALTSALAIGAGLGLVLAGLARIGWAAEFVSRPIVTGFVFGLVLLIVLGEVPSLLGLPTESGDVLARVWSIAEHIDLADPLTVAISAVSLTVLLVGTRIWPRAPWALLVLVGGIALSTRLDLAARGVAVVGAVPAGLPPLGLPGISLQDVPPVLLGGLAMGLVGLAEGLSAGRLFAARLGYRLRTDQELVATGAANVAAGFSGGMGVAGSLSKTAAAVRTGGASQLTGLTAAGLVLVVLVSLTSLLTELPRAVLSAIVVQAVWVLMDVGALRRFARVRRNDFVSALAALVGVLVLGPLYGLLFAIGQSLLGLVYRSSRAQVDVMGKVPGEKAAWGSVAEHPERQTVAGILVLRLDVPLFWANAEQVVDRVIGAVDAHPDTRVVLLDLEATTQLDTTSVDALDLLLRRLRDRGLDLSLVRVFRSARVVLRRAGFLDRLGPNRMWHSISAAVVAARAHLEAEGVAQRPLLEPVHPLGPDEERIAVHHRDGLEEPEPGLPVPRAPEPVTSGAQHAVDAAVQERHGKDPDHRTGESSDRNGKNGKKAKNGKKGKGSGNGKAATGGADPAQVDRADTSGP